MQKIGLEAILKMGNFTKGVKQYTKGVAGMEKSTTAAGKGMKGFGDKFATLRSGIGTVAPVIAGAVAAFYTLKKAFDFGREGAVIQQTTDSFNDLMESMGVGPSILDDMRDATLGTVDDMTLMSSTMTLVAGTSDELGQAMVRAAPDLLTIAKAAQKLNPRLGDTAFLYQSLATGIKRSSPLILDNTGLIIKLGAANAAMATKLDKSVESLTAEERQMALLEATLEAGDRMIQQVGGSTKAMGDDFARTEAQMKNATNQMKKNLTPAVARVTGVLADFVEMLMATTDATKGVADELLKSESSYDDYIEGVLDAAIANDQLTEADRRHVESLIDQEKTLYRGASALGIMSEAQWESLRAIDKLAGGIDNFSEAMDPFQEELEQAARAALELSLAELAAVDTTANLAQVLSADATVAAAGFKGALDLLHDAISGPVGKAFDDFSQKVSDLRGELSEGKITFQEYKLAIDEETEAFRNNTNAIIFNIAEKLILDALEKGLIQDVNNSGTAFDEATVALYAMAEGLGIVDEGTLAVSEAVIDQTEAYLSGRIPLDEYVSGLGDLSGKMADAAVQGRDLNDVIIGFPSYKQIVIETYYKTRGTPPPEGGPGLQKEAPPTAYQHGGAVSGGQLTLVGEAGPELFVPSRPGTILPNLAADWGMNLPAMGGAAAGGSAFGPTINLTMNPTINNGMDLAEFQALTLQTVERAIGGT